MELQHVISDATVVDRAGSAILEHILCLSENNIQGFTTVNLKEVVITTCWYLWWLRRQRTHNESTPPMIKCRFSILSIVANASKVYGKQAPSCGIKWSRPERAVVKLNVDASFHEDGKTGAIGAVLRNARGEFIATSFMFSANVDSAVMAEAIALKEGLRLAIWLGCN
jgi:hypothetical protein